MTIEKWVEEFLWRGRPSTSTQPSAYHLVIGSIGDETLNKPILSDPMTPAQAEAAGFPLPEIISAINAIVMQERDTALADKAVAESERDEAIAAKVSAETARDAVVVELEAAKDNA